MGLSAGGDILKNKNQHTHKETKLRGYIGTRSNGVSPVQVLGLPVFKGSERSARIPFVRGQTNGGPVVTYHRPGAIGCHNAKKCLSLAVPPNKEHNKIQLMGS